MSKKRKLFIVYKHHNDYERSEIVGVVSHSEDEALAALLFPPKSRRPCEEEHDSDEFGQSARKGKRHFHLPKKFFGPAKLVIENIKERIGTIPGLDETFKWDTMHDRENARNTGKFGRTPFIVLEEMNLVIGK